MLQKSYSKDDSEEFAFYELLYTDKFMHPALLQNFYDAAEHGTQLFEAEEMRKLWKKSFKWVWDNCLYVRDDGFYPDTLHYIYKHKLTWAPPTKEDIDYITSLTDTVLEIGCGCGYWSKVLSHHCNVIPTDTFSGDKDWAKIWIEREQIEATEAIRKYNPEFILTVYPYEDFLIPAFKTASIGTKFFIMCPQIAGISPETSQWICDSSNIIADLSAWTDNECDELTHGYGIIVEKARNIEFVKAAYRSELDRCADNRTWLDFVKCAA